MRDDDDIIEAYEQELGAERVPAARRGSNRGFWIVLGTILAASAIIVVEIFANRPIADTIGRAQHDLRVAEAQARSVLAESGTFEDADAEALDQARLDDGALSVVGPDEPSRGLGEISVYADATTWAAAVSARPGACFYLKLVVGRDDPLYGVGTECTGRQALDASESRW
ncbi:MAG: hypothetical protein OEV60_02645 [Actinomycetota bacterium]|nr:hypothetical protein [Actinomycetota bacterium]MDH5224434.1 hypothetical protein [Actinomycetota bacterium]MDH5312603.1 hypothetical protein [Actinomycetota bacterium]